MASLNTMPDHLNFPMSRQPRGKPTLRYDGPSQITNHSYYPILITSDKLYFGQEGCTEKIKLTAARTDRNINLGRFIESGSLDGSFNPSGGDKSVWSFHLQFATKDILKEKQRKEAIAANARGVRVQLVLEFTHECTESIPRAVTPGREPSPTDALLDDKVFVHEQTFSVVVEVQHDFRFSGQPHRNF